MDLGTVLVKNPSAAYRVYEGKATVVLLERAEVKVVNEAGSLVWDRIDGKRTLGEIVQTVIDEFDVDPEQARNDVLEFVASLREHGMVS
jgi:hypothetical protein